MATFDEVLTASFKGVPFLVDVATTTGGIKYARHVYPNTDTQKIETLGTLPQQFELSIVISQDALGENYFERRNRLIQVLEDPAPGILQHPFAGIIDNVVALEFSQIESFQTVGQTNFTVTFAIDNSSGQPEANVNTLPVIEASVTAANAEVTADFGDTYSVSDNFPTNFEAAIDNVNQVVDTFNDRTQLLAVEAEKINSFSSQIAELADNVTTVINNPSEFATSINNLYQSVNGLYSSTENTLRVFTGFFDFNTESEQTSLNFNTSGLIERANNNEILNGIMQAQALLYAYQNASLIEYNTVSQIEDVQNLLESQYIIVADNFALSADVQKAISKTRVLTNNFFEEQKLTTNRIVTVVSESIPLSVLSYQYYGTTEGYEVLAELNNDLNVAFLSGELQVVSE